MVAVLILAWLATPGFIFGAGWSDDAFSGHATFLAQLPMLLLTD
jgi:hypothetical protein